MGPINFWYKAKLQRLIQKAFSNPELLKSQEWWTEVFKSILRVKEFRIMLRGYKSYIIAALSALVVVAHAMGYIDDATRDTLLGLLASGALGTVTAKMNRINKNQDNLPTSKF